MGRWRLALLLVLAALLPTLALSFGPGVLARAAARRLTAALGTPVHVGWLTWNPLRGSWRLRGLRIDAISGRPALVARRVTGQLSLREVLRGDTRLRTLVVDGGRLRLQATAGGWRLPLPEGSAAGAAAWPTLRIDWAAAPRARVWLETGPQVRSSLRLRLLELEARIEPERVQAALWTRGRLDRSSIAFAGKIRTLGAARRVRLRLIASDLDLRRGLRLVAAPVADVRGALAVRAKYEEAGDREHVRRTVAGSLEGHDLALRAHGVDAVWARQMKVSRFAVDLDRRQVALGALQLSAPQVWVRRSEEGLVLPWSAAETDDPGWAVTVASTSITGGAVQLLDAASGDTLLAAKIEEAQAGAIRDPSTPVPVSVRATLSTGGTLTASGEVARSPLTARGKADLTGVVLPPVAALGRAPLALESGTLSGTLDVRLAEGAVQGAGRVEVADLKTIAPDAGRPEEVMAFKTLRLDVRRASSAPPTLVLAEAQLEWPYVLVNRTTAGIFPFSLVARRGDDQGREARTFRLEIGRVGILGGRLDFWDTTVSPSYWRSLTSLKLRADTTHFAPLRVDALRLDALVDELSPLKVEGRIGSRTHLTAEYERLALPPFNAYLAGAAPYTVATGLLSGRSEVVLERSELEVDNEVVLSRLGLRRATEEDFVAREVGIPLTLALALMKDYRGNIALSLPFGGDVSSPAFSTGSVLRQAILRAVRGAVLSPLTALGRVVLRDGRVEHFDLDPVPFAPGERVLDGPGRDRVAQVAHVLAVHPELRLRVRGQVAEVDLERLGDEAALLALPADPSTARLRAYLEARLAGAPPPPIDAEEAERLATLRTTLPFPGDALRTLAVDRVAAVVGAFVIEHKIEPGRTSATEPVMPEPGKLAPLPAVTVELAES